MKEADVGKILGVRLYKGDTELEEFGEFGPVTAYATVEFDSNGGTAVKEQTGIRYGGRIEKPEDPKRPGYIFLGWYDGSTPWDFARDVVTNDYICLTAKWAEIILPFPIPSTGGKTPAETKPADPAAEPQDNAPVKPTEGGERIVFTDVAEDAWYSDAVAYCCDNGYFYGTGADTFEPETTMTRAMFVTVLYRMAGRPETAGTAVFSDVEDGTWYTDAVAWAAENGIVNGYGDGTFGADDPVTREQMVAFLYRFANLRGYDTGIGEDTNILSYDDAFDVSEWAIPAMQWAVGAGVIHGRSASTLAPQDTAIRAEVAQIIMNFDKSES